MALWLVAAAASALGILVPYFAWQILNPYQGSASSHVAFEALLRLSAAVEAIAVLGIVVGAASIVALYWWKDSAAAQPGPRRASELRWSRWVADAAARGSLIVAAVASIAVISLQVFWQSLGPALAFALGVGISNDSILRATWPSAFFAGAIGVLALAAGTRRRGSAVVGVTLSSIVLVVMGADLVGFLVTGGE